MKQVSIRADHLASRGNHTESVNRGLVPSLELVTLLVQRKSSSTDRSATETARTTTSGDRNDSIQAAEARRLRCFLRGQMMVVVKGIQSEGMCLNQFMSIDDRAETSVIHLES